jgi:hypothetical protein
MTRWMIWPTLHVPLNEHVRHRRLAFSISSAARGSTFSIFSEKLNLYRAKPRTRTTTAMSQKRVPLVICFYPKPGEDAAYLPKKHFADFARLRSMRYAINDQNAALPLTITSSEMLWTCPATAIILTTIPGKRRKLNTPISRSANKYGNGRNDTQMGMIVTSVPKPNASIPTWSSTRSV